MTGPTPIFPTCLVAARTARRPTEPQAIAERGENTTLPGFSPLPQHGDKSPHRAAKPETGALTSLNTIANPMERVMFSNFVDHVFGNELDQLLAANQVGKRVARPKRQTKPRQWKGVNRKPGEQSAGHRCVDSQNVLTLAR
jgi:hypothetical protein